MKAPSPQFVVYAAGIFAFGLFYQPVKEALGGGALFLGAAIAYLVALRVIGWLGALAWARFKR